jgi:hypothetical protein
MRLCYFNLMLWLQLIQRGSLFDCWSNWNVRVSVSLDLFIHEEIWNNFFFCCLGRSNQKVQSHLHIHYVSPSFWAWKGGESRLSKLHDFVDHMLCILPFEEEICKLNGLPATYVGHPSLDDAIGLNMVKTCVTLAQHQCHYPNELLNSKIFCPPINLSPRLFSWQSGFGIVFPSSFVYPHVAS